MLPQNYECDGQIELSDYFKSKIADKKVMDFTSWINSQGKAQYTQIGELIKESHERYKDDADYIGRMTNAVSVYVLNQSSGYMSYLREESKM